MQSALLEVMQERQVTIAGETHKVPEPFLVMATQNPIETEGTYPLPEAQVDRFMMKVLVGYPTEEEEFVIVERVTGEAAGGGGGGHDRAAVDAAGANARRCYVDPSLIQYAVQLVAATRDPRAVGLRELSPLHPLRREPARVDPPDRGARARSASCAGATTCCPQDVIDLVARRAAAPHRAVL